MQKSLITLLISSVFLLSACNENEKEVQVLSEKLQKAEQTIAQLNRDIAKSQQNLTAYQAENEQKQAEAAGNDAPFPALKVKIVTLYKKQESLKLQGGETRAEASIDYWVSLPETGIDWLDNLNARQMLNYYEQEDLAKKSPESELQKPDPNKITGTEKTDLLKAVEKSYANDLAMLKEGGIFGMSNVAVTTYLGQRNNLVMFSHSHYIYSGGAHGLYWTNYVNIDIEQKKVIGLDDIIAEGKKEVMKERLWQAYQNPSPDEEGKTDNFMPKDEFYLAEDFLFTDEGVKFVYPPYSLASFAAGEVSLIIPWEEANPLLTEAYRREPANAYELSPTAGAEQPLE